MENNMNVKKLLWQLANITASVNSSQSYGVFSPLVKLQERITELQHAIKENSRKLDEVQQKRLCVEDEIIQWYRYYGVGLVYLS